MILRPLGQSGYELKTSRTRILIDPYLSDIVGRLHGRPRLLPVPSVEMPCDGVFCTHNHLDHLDPETAVLFPEDQAFFSTPEGCVVLHKLGKKHTTDMQLGQSIVLGDMEIIPVFAAHTVDAIGLVVKAEGITLYFSGDTLYSEKLYEIGEYRPDITLICINGRLGNMTCDEALLTAKAIGARVNVPNHYDMFASNSADPHQFADHISGGKILAFDTPYDLSAIL